MEAFFFARDESLARMVEALSGLIAATNSIKQQEPYFMRFSDLMIDVKEFLIKQQFHSREDQDTDVLLKTLLQRMDEAVKTARETIEGYNTKSSIRLLFASSVHSKLEKSSKEIASVLSLLPFTQIKTALDLENKVDAISHSLKSLVPRLQAYTGTVHPGVDGSSRVSPIETPKVHTTQILEHMMSDSFLCPLTGQIMEDPVYASCSHSYERSEIEKYFRLGHKLCRICEMDLRSITGKLELKPNIGLRDTILECKQKSERRIAEMIEEEKVRDCGERIVPDDIESTNQALKELQDVMMKTPSCIREATESPCNLVSKLTWLFNTSGVATATVLQCLLQIAKFSNDNKLQGIIGRGAVIKCLLNQTHENEAIAIEILFELSKNSNVAQKITETKTSIARLVALLNNPNSSSSPPAKMARAVLMNLSTNVDSTMKIAMSGYLPLFLHQFNSEETSVETRASLAEKLAKMQLSETAMSCLEEDQFINNLGEMLNSSSLEVKLASLKCIKRLMEFDGLRSLILSIGYTIPASLLRLITDKDIDKQWKQESLAILISLIEINPQPLQQQSNTNLTIFCFDRIQYLVEKIRTSTHEDQVFFLQLLLTMVKKSDTVLDWVIFDPIVMSCLYSSISPEKNGEVRLSALKLISYITGNNHDLIDIPFPSNPCKETALNYIITTLKKGGTDEEISLAANIISHLPCRDSSINSILQNSAVLEALKFQLSDANKSHELLENSLGALLRCMDQSNPEFLIQLVSVLEQTVVKILSVGSLLMNQRAAMILAHLARCAPELSTRTGSSSRSNWFSWPSSSSTNCTVHNNSSCLLQRITCLAKARAVRPLVCMLNVLHPDSSEAALMALHTLFEIGNLAPHGPETSFFKASASAIVENKGVAPILEVLEKGPLSVKKTAFELMEKIYRYHCINTAELEKFRAILIYLLNEENELSKNARTLIQEFSLKTCLR